MGKAKKEPKKNPTIRVKVKCPGCNKMLIISAYRKRTNPTVKAQYDVWTEVEVDNQKTFDGLEDEPTATAKAAATKKKKARKEGPKQ